MEHKGKYETCETCKAEGLDVRWHKAGIRRRQKERRRAERHLAFVRENPDCEEDLQDAEDLARRAGVEL